MYSREEFTEAKLREEVSVLVCRINARRHSLLITRNDAKHLAHVLTGMDYKFSLGDEQTPSQFYNIDELPGVQAPDSIIEQRKYDDGTECTLGHPVNLLYTEASNDALDVHGTGWVCVSQNSFVRDLIAVRSIIVLPRYPSISELLTDSYSIRNCIQLVNLINTSKRGITLLTWKDLECLNENRYNFDAFSLVSLRPYKECDFFFDPYIEKHLHNVSMVDIFNVGEAGVTDQCVITQRVKLDEDGHFREQDFPTAYDMYAVEVSESADYWDDGEDWDEMEEGVYERQLYAFHSVRPLPEWLSPETEEE